MNRWLKGAVYGVAGLVCLILAAAAAVYGLSEARLHKQYSVTPAPLAIPTDSIALARGKHLASSVGGCIDCHGENMAGNAVIDNAPIGRIVALNLTSGKGGIGGTLSDADFVRAIRHGVAPNGRALKLMPSSDYARLSDEDLAAVIGWVKSRPPVDHELPEPRVGPVGRALLVFGKLPILHAERIDHTVQTVSAVRVQPTAEYGRYLASIGCMGCHGTALAGGPIAEGPPEWPPAANLTPAGPTKEWSEDDFRKLLREGKRPDGTPVNVAMPWKTMGNMTDEEMHAVWLYLKSIPAAPTPGLRPATN